MDVTNDMMATTCTPAPDMDVFGDEDYDWEDDEFWDDEDWCEPEKPDYDTMAAFIGDLNMGLVLTQDAYALMDQIDDQSSDFEAKIMEFITAIGGT